MRLAIAISVDCRWVATSFPEWDEGDGRLDEARANRHLGIPARLCGRTIGPARRMGVSGLRGDLPSTLGGVAGGYDS